MRKWTKTTWGMIVLMVSLLSLIGFGIAAFRTSKNLEGVGMITGALIATVTDLKGYFWGDSDKDKDGKVKNLMSATGPVEEVKEQ